MTVLQADQDLRAWVVRRSKYENEKQQLTHFGSKSLHSGWARWLWAVAYNGVLAINITIIIIILVIVVIDVINVITLTRHWLFWWTLYILLNFTKGTCWVKKIILANKECRPGLRWRGQQLRTGRRWTLDPPKHHNPPWELPAGTPSIPSVPKKHSIYDHLRKRLISTSKWGK